MQVNGIDHVNIIAEDLEATLSFYETLLGFTRGQSPVAARGITGAWLHDAAGRAIIHLMGPDAARHGERDRSGTGAIDHVALACRDFAGTLRRCEELGVEHRVNDRKFGELRQVFVTDPNNVRIELNFAGD